MRVKLIVVFVVVLMTTAVSIEAARLPVKSVLPEPTYYSIQVVSAPRSHTFAAGINDRGVVLANGYGEDGSHHGYAFDQQFMLDLGPGSEAVAINDRNIICGQKTTAHGLEAYSWVKGRWPIPKGPRNVEYSLANDINDRGDVVGNVMLYFFCTGLIFPWIDEGGDVDLLSTQSGTARAINNKSQVVGNIYLYDPANPDAWSWPYLWQKLGKAGYAEIPLPILKGTIRGYALDINNQGLPVGFCATGSDIKRATSWSYEKGRYTAHCLPNLPGSEYSWAISCNDAGQVVGYSEDVALIWDDGQVYDLNSLIVGGNDYKIFAAISINKTGQISAMAYCYATGYTVAVRLTPMKPKH